MPETAIFEESKISIPRGVFAHKKVYSATDPDMVFGIGASVDKAVTNAAKNLHEKPISVRETIVSGALKIGDQEEGKKYTLRSTKRDREFIHGRDDSLTHRGNT